MTKCVNWHGAGRYLMCSGEMKAVHRKTVGCSTYAELSEAVEDMEKSTGSPVWTYYLGKVQE
nr:MAG: hypothetical protein [Bacteriophage sp.]